MAILLGRMANLENNGNLKVIESNDENVVESPRTSEPISSELVDCFKCNTCEFQSSSKTGLKIHETRKHGQKFKCDFCEITFDSIREQKVHVHTHSFEIDNANTSVQKCKCSKCDYTCKDIETMEVHVGKCCYDTPMCGLCDSNFNDLEMLETHLNTCEIYECGNCDFRSKLLCDIKEHVKEEQMSNKHLWHMKMNRDDKNIVDYKKYLLSDI